MGEHLEDALSLQCLFEVGLLLPHRVVLIHPVRRQEQGRSLLLAVPLLAGDPHLHAPWCASAGLLRGAEPLGVGPGRPDDHPFSSVSYTGLPSSSSSYTKSPFSSFS